MSQDEERHTSARQRVLSDEASNHQQTKITSPEPEAVLPVKRKSLLSHVEITGFGYHDQYEALPGKNTVVKVLEESSIDDEVIFKVQFGDYHEENVSLRPLCLLFNLFN